MLMRLNQIFKKPKGHSPFVVYVIDGKQYRWNGWYGCQLMTFETRQIIPGESIVLDFLYQKQVFTLTVFTCVKVGFRKYQTCWSLPNHGTFEQHNERIHSLKDTLRSLV